MFMDRRDFLKKPAAARRSNYFENQCGVAGRGCVKTLVENEVLKGRGFQPRRSVVKSVAALAAEAKQA
jgi:hypothetical protein